MEKPRARANRWIVSKHEETALTLPEDDDGSVVDEEGPWTEEEPPDRPLPSLEGPETTASEANETGSRSPCMRPRSDPPKMKNSTPDKIVAEKKLKNKITKRIGW